MTQQSIREQLDAGEVPGAVRSRCGNCRPGWYVPLFTALSRRGDPAAVGILLTNGADPNANGSDGCPPLRGALPTPEVVESLPAASADPDTGDSKGQAHCTWHCTRRRW